MTPTDTTTTGRCSRDCRHHSLAFHDVVAVWFLHVDILSCLARQNCWYGVPVVRRSDDNRVQTVVIDQAAEISECRRFPTLDAIG